MYGASHVHWPSRVHGYNALEGTFLGGCIFSGHAAGRAAAEAL